MVCYDRVHVVVCMYDIVHMWHEWCMCSALWLDNSEILWQFLVFLFSLVICFILFSFCFWLTLIRTKMEEHINALQLAPWLFHWRRWRKHCLCTSGQQLTSRLEGQHPKSSSSQVGSRRTDEKGELWEPVHPMFHSLCPYTSRLNWGHANEHVCFSLDVFPLAPVKTYSVQRTPILGPPSDRPEWRALT